MVLSDVHGEPDPIDIRAGDPNGLSSIRLGLKALAPDILPYPESSSSMACNLSAASDLDPLPTCRYPGR
jgi:hypothetical protein